MGIIKDTRKITPTCRYGHGDLQKVSLFSHDRQLRGIALPTFLDVKGAGTALMDGSAYSIIAYRCPACGYLELFDDEVANG